MYQQVLSTPLNIYGFYAGKGSVCALLKTGERKLTERVVFITICSSYGAFSDRCYADMVITHRIATKMLKISHRAKMHTFSWHSDSTLEYKRDTLCPALRCEALWVTDSAPVSVKGLHDANSSLVRFYTQLALLALIMKRIHAGCTLPWQLQGYDGFI